jgi:polysaccharide export outer membrane protein
MKNSLFFLALFAWIVLNTGCVSHSKMLNYQESLKDPQGVRHYEVPELKIQPNDILFIKVHSTDEETAAPFNRGNDNNFNINTETLQFSGYLVNKDGEIDFPVLGKIDLEGLSTSEAIEKMEERLNMFLKDPVVNLRILNFRVTVSGEVANPGSFTITNERVSVVDAIALAGGLTDYANRARVLLVREEDGVLSLNRLDLQTSDFFESEFYYLKQNDAIYVEPLRSKAGAVPDQTNKVVPIVSALGTVVAILVALFQN